MTKKINKEIILNELAKYPEGVVATAYLYAINMSEYGVNVAEKWLTAVQQTCALEKAREHGYYEALKRIYDKEQE